MTTRMSIPMQRWGTEYNPIALDDRIAYGNIPKWIVQGIDIPNLYDPNSNFQKQTMLPPLYAGNKTGIIQMSDVRTPRQPDPRKMVKAFSIKTRDLPWAKGDEMSTYLDSPYAYATSHLGKQPNRSWKFNVYNQHAKSGFKFWVEEKQPVNRSQKYTFGSAKTFLGLGNAPRN
ncbi:uncharacterized protein [Antedon mediterranea]|uniref:uncharacterized protein isoform X2 n=1 Tax=Antedon mediterranea TaxID=105859 RepID=UPI003AF93233